MEKYQPTLECAKDLDLQYPSSTRTLFHIPLAKEVSGGLISNEEKEALYFCGNSLGLQPRSLAPLLQGELDKWQHIGVMGHFKGDYPWVSIDEVVRQGLMELVGALENEVAVMGTLSADLHFLMIPFYRPTKDRYKIIIEAGAFPSDLYIACSQIAFHGHEVNDALIQLKPRESEHYLRTEDILAEIKNQGDALALVLLPGVQYYSGQFFDIPTISDAAHAVGAMAGFDLAHAAGNVPLRLHEWGVDFAAWCSYKYLNSGPGGIAGIFVHSKHADSQLPRLGGWWGVDQVARFQMDKPFEPLPGAYGFRHSNPSVLCVMALHSSLQIFSEAGGVAHLNERSRLLTNFLEFLIDQRLKEKITIITPRNNAERGCQLSLQIQSFHESAHVLESKLFEQGIICDVRGSIIRAAPTPLYNTFQDCYELVAALENLV